MYPIEIAGKKESQKWSRSVRFTFAISQSLGGAHILQSTWASAGLPPWPAHVHTVPGGYLPHGGRGIGKFCRIICRIASWGKFGRTVDVGGVKPHARVHRGADALLPRGQGSGGLRTSKIPAPALTPRGVKAGAGIFDVLSPPDPCPRGNKASAPLCTRAWGLTPPTSTVRPNLPHEAIRQIIRQNFPIPRPP